MQYRFRKPELIPTLVTIIVVTLMFSLGAWQLKRLAWKNALITTIEKAQAEAPQDLLSIPESEIHHAEWHNIRVKGHFLHAKELYATPRYLHEQMGYAVLTPLEIKTPSGKQYVIINRGWVAPEKKDILTRKNGNPIKDVTIEGVIREAQPQGQFRPDNRPDKNLWFWYDIPAMAKYTELPLMPIMIDATRITLKDGTVLKEGPTTFPIEISIRNDHLGYAITWFLIGIAGLVMYCIYYLERKPAK